MEMSEFIKEHKSLIKKLRIGNRKTLKKEASKQEKELNKYLKNR